MKTDFTGELRRRMEDACMLPPEHSEHQRVLNDIAKAGDWASNEWLGLHQENEQLRVVLRQIDVPSGLERRLREIPTHAARHRRSWSVNRRVVGSAAAILALAAAIGAVLMWRHQAPINRTIKHVAMLVANDHLSLPTLTFEGSERNQMAATLQSHAPFVVSLAGMPAGARLLGARICKLQEQPLVLSRWQQESELVSMYQFRRTDFGLPPNLTARDIKSAVSAANPLGCCVHLWTDDQFAYAVVKEILPGACTCR